MKSSAGCTQPVHSVLRRWIGDASFISPSGRVKPTLLVPPISSTNSIRITHVITGISTRRSISTTRNVGAITPSSPPLLLGNTCLRHLSGLGRVTSPEERNAAARARLESKRGNGNAPVEDAPIDLDDLRDLNAEIAGFVGSLGDPDFDAQDNAPTTSAATDRRHGHRHRTDYRDAPAGDDRHRRQQQQQQEQRTMDSDLVGHTDPAETRDKHAPASHLQPRRLTLADHPTTSASAGTRETITGDVSVESQATQRGSSWLEELRAHSAAPDQQSPHPGQGEGALSVSALGIATGIHHTGNQVAFRGHGASLEGKGRLRATKSVLVLNGAACFVGGRLASTGEPQGQVTKVMEEAAAEFNISLTVCTSNREHELLEELCAGNYDAVVYNPAGFSAGVVSSAPRKDSRSPS